MAIEYRYHSLEDFLNATMLTVDAQLDDGWGASFPVRGREIDATVLFADITAFSARTADLTPTETLVFVNNFFAWISAEALRHTHGLIDKYIGDEVMVVFSKEFGSTDPFLEAVQAARWMAENDALAFMPYWDRVWPGDRRLRRDAAQIQLLGVRGACGAGGTMRGNDARRRRPLLLLDHLSGEGVG